MADERDEIRARIDLVELVGQRVALKRAGKNWRGLCPFHDDRNPSFNVSPDIGYYRCWSCGEKGDAFDWVMKTQNLTFVEALKELAKQAGVTLRPRSGESSKSESDQRATAMDEAQRFFRESLQKAPHALEYCEGRGLLEEVRNEWELGWAPDVGEALAVHLQKKGHGLALCRSLFLVDQDAGGGYYDRFRGRLMFPIRDEREQLVAFGGRLLGDGHPKYVNSGDTPLYRKSRVLYGLNKAKQTLLETRRAVLVEGYLDVIACHQAGVKEALASLGTAFADDHAKLLKRWVDKATILYDGDEAGQKAAERACEILRSVGLQADVAVVPPGDDPDTLLRKEGPHAVKLAAAGGMSPLSFSIRRIEQREDASGAPFWNEVVAALATCDSPAEVDRHVTELAAKYMSGRPETTARATIYSMIKDHRRQARKKVGFATKAAASIPMQSGMTSSESLIFSAFLDARLRSQAWAVLGEDGLFCTEYAKSLAGAILSAFPKEPPAGSPKAWIGAIEEEENRSLLADIQFYAGFKVSGRLVEDLVGGLDEALAALRKQREERMTKELKTKSEDDDHLRKLQEHLAGKVKGRYEYSEEERERRIRL